MDSVNSFGKNFSGKNLQDQIFCHVDLRGANFTDSILQNADFSFAKIGVPPISAALITLCAFLMSLLSFGFASGFAGAVGFGTPKYNIYLDPYYNDPNLKNYYVNFYSIVLIFVVLSFLTLISARYKGWVITFSVILLVFVIPSAPSFLLINTNQEYGLVYKFGSIIILLAWGLSGILVCGMSGAMTAYLAMSVWGLERILCHIFLMAFVMLSIVFAGLATYYFDLIEMFYGGIPVAEGAIQCGIILLFAFSTAAAFIFCEQLVHEDEKISVARKLCIVAASLFGTCFRRANLRAATFDGARLGPINLLEAKIIGVSWRDATGLQYAHSSVSYIKNSRLRSLVVSRNAGSQDFSGADLNGVNLSGADLRRSVFSYCNLVEANLNGVNAEKCSLVSSDISRSSAEDANFEFANLREVNAIKCNFSRANLTGAIIESWSIDSETKIDSVNCDYVYVKDYQGDHGSKSKSNSRRPEIEAEIFKSGEFGKIFGVVVDTIDLFFRDGIDMKALSNSLEKIRSDYDVSVRSIRSHGDGSALLSIDPRGVSANDRQMVATTILAGYESQLKLIADSLTRLEKKSVNHYKIKELKFMSDSRSYSNINNSVIADKIVNAKFDYKNIKIDAGDEGKFQSQSLIEIVRLLKQEPNAGDMAKYIRDMESASVELENSDPEKSIVAALLSRASSVLNVLQKGTDVYDRVVKVLSSFGLNL